MKRLGPSRHSTCDHCGKTGLSRTIAFQCADRSIVHLGADCAKNASKRRRHHHAPRKAREPEPFMEHYKPHKSTLSPAMLRRIRRDKIGRVDGQPIYRVDGELLRNKTDIDFTTGGNAARYRYVPPGELWIESTLSPTDAAPTIVHEAIESKMMRTRRMSYDDAHEVANAYERKMRAALNGSLRGRSAASVAAEWFAKWEQRR